MDPVTTGIATGLATGAAKELGKEAAKRLTESHDSGAVCVTKEVPGSKARIQVCVEPEQVCGTMAHPKTGLPVTVCVTTKVTRSDAQEFATQVANALAAGLKKQVDSSKE